MANDDWRYRAVLQSASPYLVKQCDAHVDAVILHMFKEGCITGREKQEINRKGLKSCRTIELLSFLTDDARFNYRVIFKALNNKLSTFFDNRDLSHKLKEWFAKMNPSNRPKNRDCGDETRYMSAIEVIETITENDGNGNNDIIYEDDEDAYSGGDSSDWNNASNTELMTACIHGNEEQVENVLQSPQAINVNAVNQHHQTALMLSCCRKRNDSIVKVLISNGDINVNARDSRGRSALFYGMMYGDRKVIAALLDCTEVDVRLKDKYGLEAVWYLFGEAIVLRLVKRVERPNRTEAMLKLVRNELAEIQLIHNTLEWVRIYKILGLLLQSQRIDKSVLLRASLLIGTKSVEVTILQSEWFRIEQESVFGIIIISLIRDSPEMYETLVAKLELNIRNLRYAEMESIMKLVIQINNQKISKLMIRLMPNVHVNMAVAAVMRLQALDVDTIVISQILTHFKASDFNIKDKNGNSVFMMCCRYCSGRMVAKLLELECVNFMAVNRAGESAYMMSCFNWSTDVPSILLGSGIFGTNNSDRKDITNVMYAYNANNLEAISHLIKLEDIDIGATNKDGTTVFLMACWSGTADVVNLLIENCDIRINQRDKTGSTGLMLACRAGNADIVTLLLETEGIDVNARDSGGTTALMLTILTDNSHILTLLLQDSDVKAGDRNDNGRTAFMLGCQHGRTALVSALLERCDVGINDTDSYGKTALVLACEYDNQEVLRVLLQRADVDVNMRDNVGHSALMFACLFDNVEIVSRLLNHRDIRVNDRDVVRATAFIYACKSNNSKVVELLLKLENLDVNAAAHCGETGFLAACRYSDKDVVSLLLDDDRIEVNILCKTGSTPLMLACKSGHSEIAALLLDTDGPDINSEDKSGRTALMFACVQGSGGVVTLLLRTSRIDVNATEHASGLTAFMLACIFDHPLIVMLLLDYPGIDTNARDKTGCTALMLACYTRQVGIVSLLLKIERIDVNETISRLKRQRSYTPVLYGFCDETVGINHAIKEEGAINQSDMEEVLARLCEHRSDEHVVHGRGDNSVSCCHIL